MMTQRDRDRLVVLKKAQEKLIKQREAAEELGITPRQVKRLLKQLREQGDRAVVHGSARTAIANESCRNSARRSGADPVAGQIIGDLGRRWPASTCSRSMG